MAAAIKIALLVTKKVAKLQVERLFLKWWLQNNSAESYIQTEMLLEKYLSHGPFV